MPITAIDWAADRECDIHLLRGTGWPELRDFVVFTRADGVVEDAPTYLAANADVTLDFQPSFNNVMDVTVDPPTCSGFGITINNETGEIEVDAPPIPGPVIHNFLVHATARDSSDGKEYRTSIRVHLHNRITSAWLTPPILTLRPESGALPQTTRVRFSVRAQFDDGTVGDLTHYPDIEWSPRTNVTDTGRLIIAAGNGPSTPAVQIEAILPPDLQDPSLPNPPEIKAAGHIRFAVDWASDSDVRTETVQIQDTWPGTINPELVPNFLFLCDGYKVEDKPRFEGQVRSLLSLMKKSRLTRPFDLLATSMNYYQAFIPCNHHGISVLCEVYPEQKSNGEVKTNSDGTVNLYGVPDAEDPSAGDRWTVENVIFRLGLPVPGQGLDRPVREIRDYWDSIVDAIPHNRISNQTVRSWQKLSRRTFLEETDSVFGLAYGEYPAVSRESDNREIGFHPLRMTRTRLDPILNRLVDAQGNSMGSLWAERPDGSRPNSYRLIFIFSSLKWDRGVNFGRGYISMNVEDRDEIPARPVNGKPTFEIDLTGKITNRISHGRLVRGCHEVAHSFGLGDEYAEKGTLPQSMEIDRHYGNLQKHSDIEDNFHDIDGDLIKWRWHRIRKAAVIAGAITDATPGKFRVPVILGQALQFDMGNSVFLRLRQFPNPLPRDPGLVDPLVGDPIISDLLEIVGVADPGGLLDGSRPAGPDNPMVGSIIVSPRPGSSFSRVDAARFAAGCIVYLPVSAAESVRSDDYPFAELIALNIKDHITDRGCALNQDPDSDDICVPDKDRIQKPKKLDVDLPFCFSHKNRIVGLFSGGKTYHCGVYHPTGSCIMRNSNSDGKEFCAVCRYLLVDIIDPSKHFSLDLDYAKIYPQT
jgi:hypothetical protein